MIPTRWALETGSCEHTALYGGICESCVRALVAEEREACAKIAEFPESVAPVAIVSERQAIAAAIRARP